MHINDLNVRLLDHINSVVGTNIFAGIGMRHSQVVLPISYIPWRHINFHISKVQILDLHSVDSTNSKEIFVK